MKGRYIRMNLFDFFRNTLHEVTIVNNKYQNTYSEKNDICKNYSTEKKSKFSESGTTIGGPKCTQYCNHCVGCTIRYMDDSVKGDNKIEQRFVKCKCGHNNIFNVLRRIKYVLSGRRTILKVITNYGIKKL